MPHSQLTATRPHSEPDIKYAHMQQQLFKILYISALISRSHFATHLFPEDVTTWSPYVFLTNNINPFCTVRKTHKHLTRIFPIIYHKLQTNVLFTTKMKWVTLKFLGTNVPCTLRWPYTDGTWLYCDSYLMWGCLRIGCWGEYLGLRGTR